MASSIDYSTAVVAIFSAVVGVLSTLSALTPRIRAIERDASSADALRKAERESDAKLWAMELEHMRTDSARMHSELTKTLSEQVIDCKSSARRELAILQLLSQVAGKLQVNSRVTDGLQNILNAATAEEDAR
jgi:single-stranded DNA-specific DHH superfamily exonuclease